MAANPRDDRDAFSVQRHEGVYSCARLLRERVDSRIEPREPSGLGGECNFDKRLRISSCLPADELLKHHSQLHDAHDAAIILSSGETSPRPIYFRLFPPSARGGGSRG